MTPCLDSFLSFFCTFMSISTPHPRPFAMNYKLTDSMNLDLNLVNNL